MQTQLEAIANSIKINKKEAEQQEELRNALKEAKTKRDAAIIELPKLREQTLDHMNQSTFISAKIVLGLLKTYDPNLNT